jgi:hypothetical protein
MKHLGSETECLRARVGDAAKLTVKEPDYGKPTFARWQPYASSSPVEAPVARKPLEVRRTPQGGGGGRMTASASTTTKGPTP